MKETYRRSKKRLHFYIYLCIHRNTFNGKVKRIIFLIKTKNTHCKLGSSHERVFQGDNIHRRNHFKENPQMSTDTRRNLTGELKAKPLILKLSLE